MIPNMVEQRLICYDSERMPIPRELICDCVRCGHAWVKRVAGRPVRCPKCKQPNWDKRVGEVKIGRPATKKPGPKGKGKK